MTPLIPPEEEHLIKWTAFDMYAGGADNVHPFSLHSFSLAMILQPECQRKAQEEIDEVVGNDRLPTFSDREKLPYVDAIIKEVFRFEPVANLGEKHCYACLTNLTFSRFLSLRYSSSDETRRYIRRILYSKRNNGHCQYLVGRLWSLSFDAISTLS